MSLRNCPQCNTQIPADLKICPECGFLAGSVSSPTHQPGESAVSSLPSGSDYDVMRLEQRLAGAIFLFPPYGLLTYLIYRKNQPKAAKQALKLMFLGLGFEISLVIGWLILQSSISQL